MQDNASFDKQAFSQNLIEASIRLGLIAFLVYLSFMVLSPFLSLLLWALVLAVTLYPLNRYLVKRFHLTAGRVATLIVLIGMLIIWVPVVIMGISMADHAGEVAELAKVKEWSIPPANPAVAEWPLVGKRLFKAWTLAAENPPDFFQTIKPQIEKVVKGFLFFSAGIMGGILQFFGSLIVAGIMLAYAESGSAAMHRIARRLAGETRGEAIYTLSTATIRSVAAGVIGVAFIQALILGIGFVWAGVPGAGLLALVALLLGIAQVPALIVTLPVIGYLWWAGDSTGANIFFTLYLIIGGMADNVLKPLLLGRGIEAPMPVILLGALGGMVTSGMIGLFLGAVLLAVGYQLFMAWVDTDLGTEPEPEEDAKRAAETP